jgi:hypothetical protein
LIEFLRHSELEFRNIVLEMYYESRYKNQNFKLDKDFWTQG